MFFACVLVCFVLVSPPVHLALKAASGLATFPGLLSFRENFYLFISKKNISKKVLYLYRRNQMQSIINHAFYE